MEEQQTEWAGQTAQTLRGFAALVLALCTTALMNGSLFPLFVSDKPLVSISMRSI